MPNYARATDIGRSKIDTVEVEVIADSVIAVALKEVTDRLDEVTEQLEKTHRATELILGQEVEEA